MYQSQIIHASSVAAMNIPIGAWMHHEWDFRGRTPRAMRGLRRQRGGARRGARAWQGTVGDGGLGVADTVTPRR